MKTYKLVLGGLGILAAVASLTLAIKRRAACSMVLRPDLL